MSRAPLLPLSCCLFLATQLGACQAPADGDTSTGLPTTTGVEDGTSDTLTTSGESGESGESTDPSTTTTTGDGDGDPATGGEDNSYCVHQCEGDDDCLIGAMDQGQVCIDSTCTSTVDASCTTDQECVEFLSGWSQGAPCTPGGGECEASMQICLDIDGQGHCALAPSDFLECADAGFDEIPTTDIEGNMVVVCGRADAACHPDAYCYLPCLSDGDCASAAYPACNVDTGLCECSSDADCQTIGSSQFGTCNDGTCGCASDEDCLAAGVGDVCNPLGACGCTDDAACSGVESPYDGGVVECVPF